MLTVLLKSVFKFCAIFVTMRCYKKDDLRLWYTGLIVILREKLKIVDNK